MNLSRLTLVLPASLLVVAACSAAATATPTPTVAPTAAPASAVATPATTPAAVATSPAAAAGTTIAVGTSPTMGQILVGGNGLTLYTHVTDTATSVTCTGGCATAWPPLLVTGGAAPTVGTGVTGTVATFARSDGLGTQVTYNGKPLYFWTGDKAAGDTTGQGIAGFAVATP